MVGGEMMYTNDNSNFKSHISVFMLEFYFRLL